MKTRNVVDAAIHPQHQNWIRKNTTPIDTFTLTEEHMKEGDILEARSCPVAWMLPESYEEREVCRMGIEFEFEGIYHHKENSWSMLALIHKIDFPHIPILIKNIETQEETEIFSDGILPPISIEEYENYFNMPLPHRQKCHLDDWSAHSRYTTTDDFISYNISYRPYTWRS